jgi:hypothetical protein
MSANAQAKPFLSWSGNIYKHIYKYKKTHAQFSADVCRPGTDAKYYKLLKSYRGQGYYLPEINGDVDRLAIKQNMHHLQKKIKHIEALEQNLKKQGKFPDYKLIIKDIKDITARLLNYKKEYNSEILADKRKNILKKSNQDIVLLKKHFDILISKLPFLKSYNFPNDHLKNRSMYSDYKDKAGDKNKRFANKIFFYRRIVEDGAYDKDHSRPDLYLRSTLDTLYLAIQRERDFISENVRYDLAWTLRKMDYLLSRGYEIQLERMQEWKERSIDNYKFYLEIAKYKNRKKGRDIIKKKNDASFKMREFVYAKQAEVYRYWMKQPKLMKALFVLETILFNEVGTVDEPYGLERKDVAQVVLNRMNSTFYRTLATDQPLIQYLKLDKDKYQSEHWLNVLFRIGEFSFTYHYIPSVVKIFCPDMSRRGRGIRAKNLKISMKALNNYRSDFKALRYFSRVSMLGKIDMSSVWDDYGEIPERPGIEASRQSRLARYVLADKYQYYYTFTDPKGVNYQVLDIHDKTYAMTWVRGRPKFYYYRDPNLFTYFSKK